MDYRIKGPFGRFDWRAKHRFGIYHYGDSHHLRIFKLCIRLGKIR